MTELFDLEAELTAVTDQPSASLIPLNKRFSTYVCANIGRMYNGRYTPFTALT